MKIILLLLICALSSCAIPPSPAVAAHAAGEASAMTMGARTGHSSEADKAHDFWGGAR